ncbi:hypothetical protein LEP1GSC124_2683 [Leptospira interrogans serovar Pyrogenes str. 200701872]|uniref:Uncharacterized protein n=1 Tax=Leptospira interrogans serovar Pyrogenes str. 200701872 TaxID=1193029 RepID=M6ZG35_LEPIR|nr:hypothetical protein LEP1GSC124_2683 [Leptospira interrogans serovar Pyrogenes str. 200701872]
MFLNFLIDCTKANRYFSILTSELFSILLKQFCFDIQDEKIPDNANTFLRKETQVIKNEISENKRSLS